MERLECSIFRPLAIGAAVAILCAEIAAAWTHGSVGSSPTFTPAWQVSKLGGGGNLIYVTAYPDGTMLNGTDVQIPYIWTGSGPWQRLLTNQTVSGSFPGG